MIKSFYFLKFAHTASNDRDGVPVDKIYSIGFFSDKKKAMAAIEDYKVKPGFRDYPSSGFTIQRESARFDEDVEKSGAELYTLVHEQPTEDGYVIYRDISIYPGKAAAEKRRDRLARGKAYKDKPGEFKLERWVADKELKWPRGFEDWEVEERLIDPRKQH